MSTFADEIEARCIAHGVTLEDHDQFAEFAMDVASALALTIALAAKGDPTVSRSYLRALLNELPEMVENRASVVRETLVERALQ